MKIEQTNKQQQITFQKLLHLVKTVADSRLVGCDPLRRACFRVLNMVACDWSRAGVHRLLPLDHYRVISHFSECQVVSRA